MIIMAHNAVAIIAFLLSIISEKVEKQRVSIENYFPDEFAEKEEIRSCVEKFGGDPYNVSDVKVIIPNIVRTAQRID